MNARFRTLIIFALFALLIPLTAFGQSAAEIQEEIRKPNTQIDELNKEIATYEKQLNEVGTKKQTLENILAQIDLSRKKLAASINVTKNKIGTLQLEIQNLSKGIVSAEDAIRINEEGLGESIRRLNEAEAQSLALLVLSSQGISSIWNDMETTRQLQEAMQADIEELSEQKTSLTNTKQATEKKQAELV